MILDDDTRLASIGDVQLVVLPFIKSSEEDAGRFIRSVYGDSDYLAVDLLQERHDPNLAADFINERLAPIQAAAKEGHRRIIRLLIAFTIPFTAAMALNFTTLLWLLWSWTMSAVLCNCGCRRQQRPERLHQNARVEARPGV